MPTSKDRICRGGSPIIFVLFLLLLSSVLTIPSKADTQAEIEGDPATQETLASIRSLGSALLSWYTDSTSAAAAGAAMARVDDFPDPVLSFEEIENLLVPSYLEAVPRDDGWGHPLEIRVVAEGGAEHLFFIRSPGRDGKFSGQSYESYRFSPKDLDHDIVWADGFFVCWPAGSSPAGKE
ncbi:MAG: hypothetical protein K0U98_20760 [Deltaproteobacteria bacterium]|nr:hypothetical protein [Deltaproteobacteria bacterium]